MSIDDEIRAHLEYLGMAPLLDGLIPESPPGCRDTHRPNRRQPDRMG